MPGRGYRFVAAVNETAVNEQPPASERSGPGLQNGRAGDSRARRRLALAGLAVLAVVGTIYIFRPVATTARLAITSSPCCPSTICRGSTQDYFADGMTEALIGNLAPISALRVVSRTP